MTKLVINIVFIILLSLVIFPVKEASDWLLAQQSAQGSSANDDEDSDSTADFAKKIDFKLKFEIPAMDEFFHPLKQIGSSHYTEYGVLLPLNHASDVQTPPPNC